MGHLYVFVLLFLGTHGHSLNVGGNKLQSVAHDKTHPTVTSQVATSLSTRATDPTANLALNGDIENISLQDLEASITATGDIKNIPLQDLEASITATGDINNISLQDLEASITATGDIKNIPLQDLEASITATGDINNISLQDLEASITATGDINNISLQDLEASITATGDIKNIPLQDLEASITATGDINNISLQDLEASSTATGDIKNIYLHDLAASSSATGVINNISLQDLEASSTATGDIKNVSLQDQADNNTATDATKPTEYHPSEPLDNFAPSGVIALARKLKGHIEGKKTLKGNLSVAVKSLGPRVPRSALESHLSYKGVLAHKHPRPSTGGGNYPKDFGFKDYVPSGSVKRFEPQIGVLVTVKDQFRNEDINLRRRPTDELDQSLTTSGTEDTFIKLEREIATSNETNFKDLRKNETENGSWGNVLFELSETPDEVYPNGSGSLNTLTVMLDGMEEAADVNHASIVPVGQSFLSNDTTVSSEEVGMTFSDVTQTTLPQSKNTNEDLATINPNLVTVANETTKYVTSPTTTNYVFRKDWLSNIYRGTIIDVSRPVKGHTNRGMRQGGVLNTNLADIDDFDNSSSSSNIVISREAVASMPSYPIYSTAIRDVNDNERLPPSIYRGTIIDVTRYSTPRTQKVEEQDADESQANIVVASVATATNDCDVDNQTRDGNMKSATETGDNESSYGTMIESHHIDRIVAANSPAGVEYTAPPYNNSSEVRTTNNCIAKKPTLASTIDLHSMGSKNECKNNTPTSISDDYIQRFSSTTENFKIVSSNDGRDENNPATLIGENTSNFSRTTDVRNVTTDKINNVMKFTPTIGHDQPALANTTDLNIAKSTQEAGHNTEIRIADNNNQTFARTADVDNFNTNYQSETSNHSSFFDITNNPLINIGNNSNVDVMEGSASMIHSNIVSYVRPFSDYKNVKNIEKKAASVSSLYDGTVVEGSRFPRPRQQSRYNVEKETRKKKEKDKKRAYTGSANSVTIQTGRTNTRNVDTKEWSPSVYRGTIVDVSKPDQQFRLQTRIDPIDLAPIAGPPYSEYNGSLSFRTRVNKTSS